MTDKKSDDLLFVEILRLHALGHTYLEIGKKMGITKGKVTGMMNRRRLADGTYQIKTAA